MADLLLRRAGRVLTWAEPPYEDAAVLIQEGKVAAVVAEAALGELVLGDVPEYDAAGRAVIPGFVDAHTHLVFAGDRA
ncbi:MAG TPA: hypothetical protein VLL25_07350, partial [Acidimicrobiales bacterium]|nr:hypothetical protein [Acidimicrobiales bacterium]